MKEITYLELIHIALLVYLWGNQWHGKTILFHSDNQSVVEILNSCTLRSKRVMTLVRHIVFWFLLRNFHIKAQFLPGFTNVFADLISRGNFQKFKTLAPLADIFPTSVPETFLETFRPQCVKLLEASNSDNTWLTYRTGLSSFQKCRHNHGLNNV